MTPKLRRRRAPAPLSDYTAAADSPMNADGRKIATALGDLVGLLEAYLSNHDANGLEKAISAAGVPTAWSRPGWREMGAHLVEDARGLLWILETAGGSFASNVIPVPEDNSRGD